MTSSSGVQRPLQGDAGMVSTMIGVDEARETILAAFSPLDAVTMPIPDAVGLVLARNVFAAGDLPPFTNSAMDGFALRAAETAHASPERPVTLRVVAEAAAGRMIDVVVEAGTAVRIMTGAPLPRGADAVVRFEGTDEADSGTAARGRSGDWIGIHQPATPGTNVRPAGEDCRAGALVVAAGTRLRPAEIGLLAMLNQTGVTVHRRPRVAILATGDELVEPGDDAAPGQIRNSNSALIAAFVQRCGGEPLTLGIARDTVSQLREKLALARATDLIVTTGGVSVGDYDLVKRVLQQDGRIDLWQVRIKPGKPLAFGWFGEQPLIGLPGNPAAVAVACEQFVRPAIRKMLGWRNLTIPTIHASCEDRVENRGGRRQFVPVTVSWRIDRYHAALAGPPGAGLLATWTHANGLMIVPEAMSVVEPGTVLPVQMVDRDDL